MTTRGNYESLLDKEKRLEYLKGWRSERNKKLGGLQCPICGFWAVSLGSHLFYEHKIRAKEFREKMSYTRKHRLTSEDFHLRMSKNGKMVAENRGEEGVKRLLSGAKKAWKKDHKKNYFSEEQRLKASEQGEKNKKHLVIGRTQKTRPWATSKYLGVHYDKIRNCWIAQMQINYKPTFIGRFKTEKQAYLARKNFEKENKKEETK